MSRMSKTQQQLEIEGITKKSKEKSK